MIDIALTAHPLTEELRKKLDRLVAKCVANVVYDAQFAYESGRMPGFKIAARDLENGVLAAVSAPAREFVGGLADHFGISAFRVDLKLDYKNGGVTWKLQFGMVEDIADPDQASLLDKDDDDNGEADE